jgi:hypothetical protein
MSAVSRRSKTFTPQVHPRSQATKVGGNLDLALNSAHHDGAGSERSLSDQPGTQPPAALQPAFAAGIEDLVILPLVLVAVAARYLGKGALSILIHILDYAFPILLQIVRFPLFTVRIIGDALAALLRGIIRVLPLPAATRGAWRDYVSASWAWLRQKLSYKAFEEALHHWFEDGMAWVFRKCRTLTPRTALLVIIGAVLWLPISFEVATGMHAVLIAKAMSLPAWMQLLHPLATIIAKSKLLVLPVYPAAWPQAKKHPFVQALGRLFRYLAGHYLMQKTAYRYRQMDRVCLATADAMGRAATRLGLGHLSDALLTWLNALATCIGNASRAAATRTVAVLSRAPLIGPVVSSYAARYAAVHQPHAERASERVSGFFARWSIKFTAEYYEAKERAAAAIGHSGDSALGSSGAAPAKH